MTLTAIDSNVAWSIASTVIAGTAAGATELWRVDPAGDRPAWFLVYSALSEKDRVVRSLRRFLWMGMGLAN